VSAQFTPAAPLILSRKALASQQGYSGKCQIKPLEASEHKPSVVRNNSLLASQAIWAIVVFSAQ
jgi:hypothetical protein